MSTSVPVRGEASASMRIATNPVLYVVGYLVLMIPTYVLPYFGSNSHIARETAGAIGNALAGSSEVGSALRLPFWFHLICLVLLVGLALLRGRRIGRAWLAVFPAVALAFDMAPVLSLIPFVPTVLHLLAIILGVTVSAPQTRATAV